MRVIVIVSLILLIAVCVMPMKEKKDVDVNYVVVLGAKVLDDNTPCKILEDRLLIALDYLNEGNDSKVVVSGGNVNSKGVIEAHVMKNFLIEKGIDKERILVEDRSKNTFENLKFTRELIGNEDSILIISSKYHLLRAKLLAKRVGFKEVYLRGGETSTKGRFKNISREVFAYIKSFIFDW